MSAVAYAPNAKRAEPALLTEGITPAERAASVALAADIVSRRIVTLDAVRSERVTWLWPGRIPLGKLTVLDGDPGLGKSLITLDVAARVTTGGRMPDGTGGGEPAGVVLWTAEDDPADTIRPRLDAAGADVERILSRRAIETLDGPGPERPPCLADLVYLKQDIDYVRAALVVIDPVMAYLPGSTDSHRDQDVRALLAPLGALASSTGVAIVIVRHLNKAAGGNPLYRGGGSIGIVGAARSALLVARDPDDESGVRKVLAMTKANLSAPVPALAYTIETANEVPRVRWEGATEHTAAQLVRDDRDDDGGALGEARAWLAGELAAGPRPSRDLIRDAKQAGIQERTLWRAKKALGAVARRDGSSWTWSLGRNGRLGRDGETTVGRRDFTKAAMTANTANGGELAEGSL